MPTKIHGSKPLCKICGSDKLIFFAHTANCLNCGVLLCYPYPNVREEKYLEQSDEISDINRMSVQSGVLNYHLRSGVRNHYNFTNMALFALDDSDRQKSLCVLDYGGGGGQFSLVIKSLFPKTIVYIVDMVNEKLLDEFEPLNKQIKFKDFESNSVKFDIIFMNDVFEHVSDPLSVLITLQSKLSERGRIFIDTPCQFWIYPFTRFFSKKIYTKLLKGTVNHDHQQIWSEKSFETVIKKAGLKIVKFSKLSEYTQGANFYLENMGINSWLKFIGELFYSLAPYIAKNKIVAVLGLGT